MTKREEEDVFKDILYLVHEQTLFNIESRDWE